MSRFESNEGCIPRRRRTWFLLDDATEFGGHQAMTIRILRHIASGCAPAISYLLPRDADRTREMLRGLPLEGVIEHSLSGGGGFLRDPGWMREVVRITLVVRQTGGETTLVGIPGSLPGGWLAVLIGRLAGVPVTLYVPNVRTMASVGARLGAQRDRLALRLLGGRSRIVVIAPHQAESLRARGIDPNRLRVLENFLPDDVDPVLRPPSDRETLEIGVIGRVSFGDKGQDILVDLARDPHVRIRYHVVGDGPDLERLRRAIRSTIGSSRVVFHGWSPPWEIPYHAILLPSRMEGVPLVVLEAVLRGIPVLASNLPETRDLLPEFFLFDRASPRSVEDRLRAIASLEGLKRIESLRERFRHRFLRVPSPEELVAVFGQP